MNREQAIKVLIATKSEIKEEYINFLMNDANSLLIYKDLI